MSALLQAHRLAHAASSRALPEGAPIAFFDMDNTVLTCNSAGRYARFLYHRGELRLRELAMTARWLLQYKLAIIDAESVTRRVIGTVTGQPEIELATLCLDWFEQDICHFVSGNALARVRDHQERGHHAVLLTAATNYIAGPVSRHLALDAFISTTLDVVDGALTGRPAEPLCYGAGKIHWARRWAADHGGDLAASYFYTDSYTDLPMLQAVGHPVAINPDPRLRRHARRHQIPIERWS